MIKRLASLTAILALAASPAVAASPAPTAPPSSARLLGNFLLTGTVTVASNVRGERKGQSVSRIWSFTPGCPVGVCSTILLARGRASASDLVVLHQRAPALYAGSGVFYAPLRCANRIYSKGQAVPFTITVRVTAATPFGPLIIATQVSANYTNRSRINLTPCVGVLGHDAATYQGHPVPTAPA